MALLDINILVFISLAIYTGVAFLLSLFRPSFGLLTVIPIIVLGFANSSLIKGGFIAVITLGIILNTLFVRRRFNISKRIIAVILFVLVLILWILFRSLFDDNGLSFWLFWVVKRVLAPSLLALLVVFLVRTEKDIYSLIYVLLGSILITATVGLFQYFSGSDIFWTLRESLGVPTSIAYQIFGRVRITGLSSYVVPLAYSLVSIIPIVVALCFSVVRNMFTKIILIVSLSILSLALALTFIKSGIGGAILGSVVVIILLLRSHVIKKQTIVLICLLLIIFSPFIILNKVVSSNILSLGQTSYERIPIALAALKILSSNPLGVGYAYSDQVEDVFSDVSDFSGSRVALFQFPHNIILNISVILGLPALVIVMLFYLFLFKGLFRIYKNESGNLQILASGLIGSFSAYILNSMFHNNSPFFGDVLGWLFIGTALSLINFAHLRRLPHSSVKVAI
jgi:O-antigen ligase